MKIIKPTKEELVQAVEKTVPDVIAPNLKVLFCGINPGLYSAAVGHHFARPGNRFWRALFDGGFTPRLFSPFEEAELLKYGYGITNIVDRPTLSEKDLTDEELIKGREILEKKILHFQPQVAAIVGINAYRRAFERPKAYLGLQPEAIGKTRLWVLPNPSGLNAAFQKDRLAELFLSLFVFVSQRLD